MRDFETDDKTGINWKTLEIRKSQTIDFTSEHAPKSPRTVLSGEKVVGYRFLQHTSFDLHRLPGQRKPITTHRLTSNSSTRQLR